MGFKITHTLTIRVQCYIIIMIAITIITYYGIAGILAGKKLWQFGGVNLKLSILSL